MTLPSTGGHCRDCVHFDPAGAPSPSHPPDYGYCRAGTSSIERARLLPAGSPCLFAFRFTPKEREGHV